MKSQGLFGLFIYQLEDIYAAELQIIEALPKLIKNTLMPDLKEALSKHLKETNNQVRRLEKIFNLLNCECRDRTCHGMAGLLKEGEELIRNKPKSAALDAAIISAAQKVEHYEIAAYGTLKSFAKSLELNSEIADLLQDSLDEEGAADKKLTKIAEGSIFSHGINQEAVENLETASGRRKR